MNKLDWYRKEAIRLHDRIHAEMIRADKNELRSARIEKQTIERCARVAYALENHEMGDAILELGKNVLTEPERRSWQNAIE